MDLKEKNSGEGNTGLIINAQGQTKKDIENIKASDILIPKDVNPTSSQNEIDSDNLDNDYNISSKDVETPTQLTEDGKYKTETSYNVENQSFEETKNSKEMPPSITVFKAEKKEDDTTKRYWDKEVDGAINDAYKKQEEARGGKTNEQKTPKQNYWDNPEKIKENFNSLSEGMKEDDANRYNQFQETGESQSSPLSVTEDSPIYKRYQNEVTQRRDTLHQEALESNREANEGMPANAPASDGLQAYLERQESDKKHQKELEENEKQNQGFKPLKPLSQTGQDYLERQERAREEQRAESQVNSVPENKGVPNIAEENFQTLNQISNEKASKKEQTLEEKVKALIHEQKPIPDLKALRSSGEVEDGWTAINTFIDENDILRVRIVKEGENGAGKTTLVKLEELIQWNKPFTPGEKIPLEEPQTIENPEVEALRNEIQELSQRLNELSTKLTQLTQAEGVTEGSDETDTDDSNVNGVSNTTAPQDTDTDSGQPPIVTPPPSGDSDSSSDTEDQTSTVSQPTSGQDSNSNTNQQPPNSPTPATGTSLVRNNTPQQSTDFVDATFRDVTDNTEAERKERNAKRWLMVAGVAAGGATGILGGAQVASVGLIAVGVTRLANWGVGKLSTRNTNFLAERLKDSTLPDEERMKLEKRLNTWKKVSNISKKTGTFLKGATYGLIGSMMISNLFMGGEGLMTGAGSNTVTPELTPQDTAQPQIESTSPKIDAVAPQGSVEIPDTNLLESLVQNNHLDVSKFGWDYQDLGWNGPRLFVPQADVVTGGAPQLQGEFLKELFGQGITEDLLMGQDAGKIFNEGLMNAVYRGGDMTTSVQNTAEALKALGQ